ncbi:MerR family transcriptional regulator [Halalkalibacterium halodurans]|uniref:Transcriptional regulator of multidrug-efflux transporter genes n=1 Tax=Halalkalibacterium halodurans (strain ATCC BAA-125 / DSM 18197 / FERM 7344 / JCM 9153 / C-125) TaxID=272558 RepID=Q9K774_HALH5|nr:MerR family transcriptional regulator [Halalkalibacterium halodurans]MDY7224022.1 MerR family transcriptional regulator [Halalkalibacterium halodurans]MDY7243307.1 MerR family transcriptional regulator [Halalkalibacterium halodurans]MED4080175.1 MerR family transcriptional regulator [Halalkalibacterium halodurans]MED4083398.1 MerR family transcriptional regulator [Halalkalibacterium halodurans]MED4105140.1 MerR family transcriptional regulator [Halalkalibacterium halodurans]
MKNQFPIGEMAKLHNTSIKTLRYYDEIGLLKPDYIDPNNGYRYYSTEQFEHLNTIHYLKELGFSLKEIKKHLEDRDIDGFLTLLEKQKELTEAKIKELERINRRFENRIHDIKWARHIEELGIVTIKDMEKRKIVRLKETIRSEPELEITLRQLENKSKMTSSIFIGGVGLTVSMRNIKSNKFNEYNSIFILIEDDIQNPLVATLQEGKYACIYFRGNHHDSPKYYKALLNYIQTNNLHMIGDAIERTIIDHYISESKDDYLTEIQIPIKY